MSAKLDAVLADALSLPPADRAAMAARLIDSLDEGRDEEVEVAWDAEIARRLEEIDSGRARRVPWEEARRRIVGENNGASAR